MSYEAFAYYYDSLMDQDFYNDYIQFINEHVKDYQTVLELGCGTGEIAIRLAHLGKQVCATDISKDMLEVAKYKCIDFKADVMLSRIDMCDFAVDRGNFVLQIREIRRNDMRLDKYLKVSRIIKRRTVANEACDSGRVMLNDKVARASAEVKAGDVIEIAFGNKSVKVRVTSVQESIRKEDAKEMFEYL